MRTDQLLEYSPETGVFTWKEDRGRLAKKGDVAGTVVRGYVKIKIEGIVYSAHRLALTLHGYDVEGLEIDHINGDRSDNRLVNLRVVNHSNNQRNCGIRSTNTTGYKNVSKRGDQFLVTISTGGRQKYIGKFKDLELAALVAEEARYKYHGEYTRGN